MDGEPPGNARLRANLRRPGEHRLDWCWMRLTELGRGDARSSRSRRTLLLGLARRPRDEQATRRGERRGGARTVLRYGSSASTARTRTRTSRTTSRTSFRIVTYPELPSLVFGQLLPSFLSRTFNDFSHTTLPPAPLSPGLPLPPSASLCPAPFVLFVYWPFSYLPSLLARRRLLLVLFLFLFLPRNFISLMILFLTP
ncbi:hypothetical protein EV356DRAFT_260869 [Viridothelium virens]|uniref:Uncharacterized protein n=1 Tax=Viridothelium virens TaxID=1048519 RepID=A0A6A6H339_VIRVR|nr:hypothetical protein EV356DRAFT_260869 [Viridothelium virens]